MPCCTYLNDNEYTSPTTDIELNKLLSDVRRLTGDDWRIHESVYETRRWFRPPLLSKNYELYGPISGPEFQIINFYRPERSDEMFSSINHNNSAGHVAAFLYGMLVILQQKSLV
jgi:hypothetical protein